jgi:hypothetical protein
VYSVQITHHISFTFVALVAVKALYVFKGARARYFVDVSQNIGELYRMFYDSVNVGF